MSTIAGVEGFGLGDGHDRAAVLAARVRSSDDGGESATVARLRAQLADAQARAVRAEDQARQLAALLDGTGGR